jgi:hypothetical protein
MITSTLTKSSRNEVALTEGDEGIGFETPAILASPSPLGIIAMGTFPLSLIALGQSRRRHFDDTLTLRPERPPWSSSKRRRSDSLLAVPFL